ncbi:MAG: thiamine pyrophosphate-binding protein [Acetobacteraceae bacterium]|nr:thiamine pyrophosphate-binding protein [Acetobacteraceae bacterium]
MTTGTAKTVATRAPVSGGRMIASQLALHGADTVFAVPGESYLDLLDGLYEVRDQVRLITCRFEAGAVNMAEAYGKLTGRPGVAIVTRGPGACHGAIGVHTAQQDSTPLIMLVGQIPSDETDRDSFQEIDYRRMFGGIAKWVTQIEHADRVPEIMHRAFHVAVSGRPGPVVIALPEGMQLDKVTVPSGARYAVAQPACEPSQVAAMREMLSKARRPLVLLGGGAFWTDAGRADIRAFAEANRLPVAVGFRRQMCVDGSSASYVGDIGVGPDPALVARAREADFILAVGNRLGESVTQGYTLFAHPKPDATIVQVYPAAEELSRVFQTDLAILADVNAFAAAARAMAPIERAPWAKWTSDLRALREAGRTPPDYAGALDLGACMRTLESLLPEECVLTTDAGNFSGWATRFLNLGPRQRYIGPCNGAMGYAVPAAIGAKVLKPGRMTVAFVGDGGFLMTGQEIATAFHHGLNPIILVFNNQMYGTIRMHQERDYPYRVSGTSLTNPDFAKFIESFGGHGETVTKTAEFAPAFERAAASGKPALIELMCDPDQLSSRASISGLRAKAKAEGRMPPTPASREAAKPAARSRAPAPRAGKPKR